MIISLKRDDSSFRKRHLLCLDALVDKPTLIQRAKVKPGSYAGELISNLHDEIFCYSLDLKSDYSNYYEVEYGKFYHYARRRLMFDDDIAQKLVDHLEKSAVILLFEPPYYFLEDEYGFEFLGRLL